MSVKGGPSVITNGLNQYFLPYTDKCFITGSVTVYDLSKNTNAQLTDNMPSYNGTGWIFNSGALTGQALQMYTYPTTGLLSLELVAKRIPGSSWSSMIVNTSLYYTGGTSYEVNYSDTQVAYNTNLFTNNPQWMYYTFPQNKYTHFYFLFNSGIKKLYANGDLVGSGDYFPTGTRPIAKSISLATLCNPVGPPPIPAPAISYGTECEIALVRNYTRELTAAEVKQNFNTLKSRFGL